ncbi:MAG: class I SAM-dependent methyltransferase [Armatimonadetes bacterium]|nr:class I SAM-dependent methyltransferase [Armatimonadota bacterium]
MLVRAQALRGFDLSGPRTAGGRSTRRGGDRVELSQAARESLGPVGKVIGDHVYVHRSALDSSDVPARVVASRARHLPRGFRYDIVKYDRKSEAVSFIQSPDWDTADEPTVGDSCRVTPDGKAVLRKANPENPQIYHRKYQFVRPDYTGFDVDASRRRAQRWEKLKPDLSRIGYKKYWESQVLPRLADDDYSAREMEIANRTARAHGAVGARAIVPRFVEDTSKKSETILDFGAGPEGLHARMLRQHGFRHVRAFEFGTNVRSGVHDPHALERSYDTVYASNVLNVQSSEPMLEHTLDELQHLVEPDGRLVANLPESPRKMDIDAERLEDLLQERFAEVHRVGGSRSAPLLEARHPL